MQKGISEKVERLGRIYRLHEEQIESLDLACRKYCADCCTANVTMTRLEGTYILHGLDTEQQADLFLKLAAHRDAPRFQPRMTTNGFAEYCRSSGAHPGDEAEVNAGPCPFLQDNACTIYAVRPFGCRCMISERQCRITGDARIDPYTLTIDTVFLQFIEDMDKDGFFGNLHDVLFRLYSDRGPRADKYRTIPCHPIPALMIPPEHRQKIRPLLDALNERITGM